MLALLVIVAVLLWLLIPPKTSTATATQAVASAASNAPAVLIEPSKTPAATTPAPSPATKPAARSIAQTAEPVVMPQRDPNDLASYIRPGDQEPSAAELIHALREAGETGGIAAFNPPGTSPALPGLAVPEDFVLPPGFVRHHQVSDDGVPIEPILMFTPEHVLYDAQGQVIALPQDLVVPPELAPPGLPIRQVQIPPP
jgi:hypothetical protein